jgi:hypothetical protein
LFIQACLFSSLTFWDFFERAASLDIGPFFAMWQRQRVSGVSPEFRVP